ncbi:hypothetical protein NUACC21_46440 [Scytonema sp. NUACC21]
MTSRLTETQNLIADIDRLLTNKRLSRFLNSQASEPRQILEQLRGFLMRLAQSDERDAEAAASSGSEQQIQQSRLLARFAGQEHSPSQPNELQQEGGTPVVRGEENNQFSAFLAPLQAELQALLQERTNLVEEIRQLEQKRLHNYSLAQQLANQEQMISEFLQVLKSRLVSNTTPQIPETVTNPQEKQIPTNTETASATPSASSYVQQQTASEQPSLESLDRVEQISRLARELDQKILALDGTVNVVFDSLQRNIHTYHESLSQALSRMHSQGVQGEQLLTSLINNLTEHLQEATSERQSSSIHDVQEETPKPPLSQQLTPELPQPKQVESLPSPTIINPQVSDREDEDTATTTNLDGVLSPLNQDTQTPSVTTDNLPPDSSELGSDEVDQLYASLFGNTAVDEVTDVTSAGTVTQNIAHDNVLNVTLIETATQDVATDEVKDVTSTGTVTQDVSTDEASDVTTTGTVIPDVASDEVTDVIGTETVTQDVATAEVSDVTGTETVTQNVATDEATGVKDDLAVDTPITPVINQAQPEVASQEGTVETKQVKKFKNFLDDLFIDVTPYPFINTSLLRTNPLPKVVPPEVTSEGKGSTNFIDELFMDVRSSPSTAIPPQTTNQQNLDSETFLHEVVFEAPNVPTDLPADEVKGVTDELSLDNTSLPADQTNQEQSDDSAASIPDPWMESAVSHVLEGSHTVAGDRQDVPVENTGIDIVSDEADLLVDIPPSADTISALTDLLSEINEGEQSIEVSSSESLASTGVVTSATQASLVVVDNRDVDSSQEIYTPASLAENLLSQEENNPSEVADISLEEAQLQQLEQDLASFDGELNSLLQPLNDLDNREKTQSRLIPQEAPSPAAEPGSSAEKELVAETEKKNEATQEQLVGSLVSISHSTNDTEVTLDAANSVWYLGIDLGTTGISAALLNRSTTEIYPLYWTAENQPEATSKTKSFRLPAEVYLPTASVSVGETESLPQEQTTSTAVTEEKLPDAEAANSQTLATPTHNLFSAQLKPYLQIALPYKNERQKWEPVLQLNEFSTVPLVWVVRSLSKLLLTLMADRSSTTLGLTAAAVGIDQEVFRSIISHLTGVICTCPSNWSEQYRFNIREAILTSKLVQHSQQVFFVEEAIACLLSELDGASGEIVKIKGRQGSRLAKTSDRPLMGSTLVISIGADATEMALVDLPENLEDLTHNDFMLHGFTYAGKGVEQDIICQLLLPPKWRQPRTNNQGDSKTVSSNPWHWQPAVPGLDQMQFSSLSLEEFNLPRPGEPDVVERVRLQQRLESSLLGKAVVDAAVALKLILQHQESFTLELADQRWVLHRRDLESHVFVPFVRRLNRELNRLLVAKGLPTEGINQAILTGGVASLGAVSRWLRQKLPNARIIQDLYLGENGSPSCSRVAYGLAVLPLHPQVLEVSRQQYTDYFLFTELLRILPTRPISFGEVIQLFENRGINTRNCQQRLLAFLEGELPPGLIPSSLQATWLTQTSSENPDYKAIAAAPIFEKQGSLTYRPNAQQLQLIARYLNTIKASTRQSLDEPYTVNFALGVVQ